MSLHSHESLSSFLQNKKKKDDLDEKGIDLTKKMKMNKMSSDFLQ